jgi:DNA-binding MarR family transcriptional regulator
VRGEHPTSKRAKVHTLTDEGHELRAAIHRQDISNMETMLKLLNGEERKQIISIMTKVAKGLSIKEG